MLKSIIQDRKLIWKLAKNDFKTKYAGSYLGVIWGVIQPIVTIVTYWIVFQYGLKVGTPIKDTPYVLWFISGMVPWIFFSEALTTATNSLLEYNYLVKKLVFNISILPLIKIISAAMVHAIFMGFVIIIYLIYGRVFSINFAQLFIYFICMLLFLVGLSYITAALQVFMKDLSQFISIFLQIFMWATPILWDYNIIPKQFQWIMKMNPMFFIVDGYRKSFLHTGYFWDDIPQLIYYIFLTSIILALGFRTFKKLQPHFADVL